MDHSHTYALNHMPSKDELYQLKRAYANQFASLAKQPIELDKIKISHVKEGRSYIVTLSYKE